MKQLLPVFLLAVATGAFAADPAPTAGAAPSVAAHPDDDKRIPSPGHTTYFVNPSVGDDANTGIASEKPWRSFAKINALKLAPGDKVVVAPGVHRESLVPFAQGTAAEPVVIEFQPGVHAFESEKLIRRAYAVSNSCDAPEYPMPIAILVKECKHLRLAGGGVSGAGKTRILLAGPQRTCYFINDRSEDIAYSGLAFDLKRPTVSEFRVLETTANTVVVQVAEGCTYDIKDGKFAWTGDIGRRGFLFTLALDPVAEKCWRIDPPGIGKAEDLGGGKVRFTYAKGTGGMTKGVQYIFRDTYRDVVSAHTARCRDIAMRDCDFYAFTGMSIVSQFSENLTFSRVRAAPEAGTIRTCPAWADVFHLSNCKGAVLVEDCLFSGSQDDPINCHGTHLRITGKPADNELALRYMQPQSRGFAPYIAGDEIAVVDHKTLRELPGNPRRKVTACREAGNKGKDWVVTLDGPAPAFAKDDAVDNITWHPDLTIRGSKFVNGPTRSVLITTRGKVVVENNLFKCHRPGILLEDDANGWYESTCVRNLLIRDNTFVDCGVIIEPQVITPGGPVHENIRIVNNTFTGQAIGNKPQKPCAYIVAREVKGLTVIGNRFGKPLKDSVHIERSEDVKVENNTGL
jgi:hypothetical protein